MTRKLILLFSLFVVLALLLVACGGDEAEEVSGPAAADVAAEEEMEAEAEAPAAEE